MIKDAIGTVIEVGDDVAKGTVGGHSIYWTRAKVVDLLPDKTMSVVLEYPPTEWEPKYTQQKVRPMNVVVLKVKENNE